MNLNEKRIVIAKTNHIGDVVISLPMAALIKQSYPSAKVIFLCRASACDVAKLAIDIDEIYDFQQIVSSVNPVKEIRAINADIFIQVNPCRELANLVKKAEVNVRIGSIFRWYNWLYCNRLTYISRQSLKNKRILDLQYLKSLSIRTDIDNKQISALYSLKKYPLAVQEQALISKSKFNLVLHPGAKTAKADCWSVENYKNLINSLDSSLFQIFISGLDNEREEFSELLNLPGVIDLIGKMNLLTYFNFLHYIDGIIAGSTGPLHLGCAQNKYVLGLYKHELKEIKRWGPIGNKASVLSNEKGINFISVDQVKAKIHSWI